MVHGAAMTAFDPTTASMANFSSRAGGFEAARDIAQPMINQKALSKVSGDHVADGLRASIAHLIDSERRTRPLSTFGEDSAEVRVIGEDQPSEGTTIVGESKQGNDKSLRNLKDAFEYASNVALVSLVLNGVTNGITTLTARGG